MKLLRTHTVTVLMTCLAITCAAAQLRQSTTIRKQSFDNPTIAVASFNGAPEYKSKLEEILVRCGWFQVLPTSQANRAQVKVNASMAMTPAGASLNATMMVNGRQIPVSAMADNPNLAILEATDGVLRTLFGVPAMCARKITFVRHSAHNVKELYACYLDGSGQERLTFNRAISTEPSWGHSGALVYTIAKNNALSIVLMDYKNKRQRIISHAKGLNASAALSPDGMNVALSLSRDKYVDLYVLNLATGRYRRLTRDNSVESSPCWSPDGKMICFVSDATNIGSPRLYLVPADGSRPARRMQIGGGESVSPDWSRNTNKLCFSTKSSYGNYAIAILDMRNPNGRMELVTAADGDWEAPSWAPDGRHVICTRARKGARDLVVVDTQKGYFRPITQGAVLSLPSWQPAR